jgi:uncharacterized protein YaaW (UPF0174 family)
MSSIRQRAVQPVEFSPNRLRLLSERSIIYDDVTTVSRIVTAAAYTISEDDHTIFVDPTAAPVVLTFLSALLVPEREYRVKKINNHANTVTLTPQAAETMELGAVGVGLAFGGGTAAARTVKAKADGTGWLIVSAYL